MSMSLIEEYFKLFNLDSRASKNELDIAYEVLTKDLKDFEKIKKYRNAYEYLMCEHFCVVEKKEKTEEVEETWEDIEKIIPNKVKEGIEYLEMLEDNKLSSKVKVLMATQTVNLPMFFRALCKNNSKFLNKTYWSDKDMLKIIQECCINPLDFRTITFELCTNDFDSFLLTKELQSYVKSLKKLFEQNEKLIKVFDIETTETGITGYIVAEKGQALFLESMLKTKALHAEAFLNLTSNLD